jgi:hypothetical protein
MDPARGWGRGGRGKEGGECIFSLLHHVHSNLLYISIIIILKKYLQFIYLI